MSNVKLYGFPKKKFIKNRPFIRGYSIDEPCDRIIAFLREPEKMKMDIKVATERIERYEENLYRFLLRENTSVEIRDAETGEIIKNPYFLPKLRKILGGCREDRNFLFYILFSIIFIDLYFGITSNFLYQILKWINSLFLFLFS